MPTMRRATTDANLGKSFFNVFQKQPCLPYTRQVGGGQRVHCVLPSQLLDLAHASYNMKAFAAKMTDPFKVICGKAAGVESHGQPKNPHSFKAVRRCADRVEPINSQGVPLNTVAMINWGPKAQRGILEHF
jgi:hypothetical protein